mgnify:CR=1 FL=1
MKHLSKLSKFVCTVLLLAGQANLFTGCNDDMPAESYYTFTGEMMSDFLTEHENFSLFKRIAERAGKMDFLGSRGSRTFFPATNAGVEAFLSGVRPCVVAMILATAVTMGLSTLGGYTAGPAGGFAPDGRAIAVFVLLGLVHCGYKKIRQKAPSPIGMILLSAILGIVFWH